MNTRRDSRMRLATLLACATLPLLLGCGGGTGAPPLPPPPAPSLTISTISLADGVTNKSYSFTLQLSNGVAPYTWTLTSGTLPQGLTLSAAGAVTGIPTVTGPFTFGVSVQDSASHSGVGVLSLAIYSPLLILQTLLPTPNVGDTVAFSFGGTGGKGPYTWSVVAGTVAPGLSLSGTGSLSGSPTTTGTFAFTVQLSDAASPPQVTTQASTMNITNFLRIVTGQLVVGVLTRSYSQPLQALGGTKPYSWGLSIGSLPAALNLDAASGNITGMPTTSGSFSFQVRVTDSSNPAQTAVAGYTILIQPVLAFVTTTLPDGAQGAGYSNFLTLQGGSPPTYTLQVTSGNLPPGLTLDTTGLGFPSSFFYFRGRPTTLGTFTFVVQVTDSSVPPMSVSGTFSIRINPLLVFPPASPPVGLEGQFYSFTFSASGGLAPLSWIASLGPAPPPGLSLDPNLGTLSGTPSSAYNNSFFVSVLDSSVPPQSIGQFVSVRIAGILRISTSSLPPVSTNAPTNIQLGMSGGTGPFVWSVTSGSLPAGLTLDPATGAIGGTSTAPGTSSFTVQVQDQGTPAQLASRALSWTVSNSMGRNDAIATATPLSNGTYRASISPMADPPSTSPPNPDSDYYQVSANPGAVVRLEIRAQRLSPTSPLDSVMEVVDSSGQRLNICGPISFPNGPFTQACLNDDMDFTTTDSALFLQVPGSSSGPLTFFVHVLDFRGDARPDLVYTLTVSGAN